MTNLEIRLTLASVVDNFSAQLAQLGTPMRDGLAKLHEDFDLEWVSSSDVISVDIANELFYNVYVAAVRFWRTPTVGTIRQDIELTTTLYPDIQTGIYPVPPRHVLTSSLASAVLWNMLPKFLINEPTTGSFKVLTKGTYPEFVGEFASGIDLFAVSSTNGTVKISDVSGIPGSSMLSVAPDHRSYIASSGGITIHVDFRGPIASRDPRSLWLYAFISWNSRILIPSDSTRMVLANRDGIISDAHFGMPHGVSLYIRSNLVTAWTGTGPLTYGELLTGVTMILEAVVAAAQFYNIDAVIYKNSRQTANFRVTADYPDSRQGRVSTA